MKIHGLCMVKNEADVVEESLAAATSWCDHIYVFDNGSSDGTWELVQRLASRFPQIVPFKQDSIVFSDGLRADIFNAFVDRCVPGDWWCRLDADEFYIDDPRVFLRKIQPKYSVVWSASFSYYFTEKDAAAYQDNGALFHRTPVTERLRHYVNHWSEPRFFRHESGLSWHRDDGGWPRVMMRRRAYPIRIWLKHYAYRSPEQIDRRLASRRSAIDAGTSFQHEAIDGWSDAVAAVRVTRAGFDKVGAQPGTSWRERVVASTSLDYDALDRRLVVNESLMPSIPEPQAFEIKSFVRGALRSMARRLRAVPARPNAGKAAPAAQRPD